MLALGLNSGSSFDGIDAVLVDIDVGEDGLLKRPRHAAAVRVGKLAIRDAADVEGEDRPDVAEGYEIEELQIAEPAIVAAACDATVVTQFRPVEHALGGSGAPLMHVSCLASPTTPTAPRPRAGKRTRRCLRASWSTISFGGSHPQRLAPRLRFGLCGQAHRREPKPVA